MLHNHALTDYQKHNKKFGSGEGFTADAIITGFLSADRIEAGTITTSKLASEVGQNLDLSSNTSLNLIVQDLESQISAAEDNAAGQRLEVVFPNGTAFEYGKNTLAANASVYVNGANETSSIPAANFSWQRLSGDASADAIWNADSSHVGTKSISLTRSDVGKSCVIRCLLQAYSSTNLNVVAMQVDTNVFDHSLVKSSHITLEQNKIEIASAGELDVLSGADINVQGGADINVASTGNINVQSGGNFNVESGGNAVVKSGGTIDIESSGKIDVESGADVNIKNGGDINVLSGGNINIAAGGKLHIAANDIMLTASDSLSDELASVQNEIDGIEVGGRNLALDSGRVITNNDYNAAAYYPSEILQEGEEYTVSMCVAPAANVADFRLVLSGGYYTNAVLTVSGTAKQVVSQTFIAHYYPGREPSSPTDSYARLVFYRFPNNGTVTANSTIYWVKVEKGNKATDWTPAPEDPVENLTNTVVKIDSSGVTMSGGIMDFQAGSEFKIQSGGTFNVFANDDESSIKFGGTQSEPNFSLGAGGTVKAVNGYFDNLVVKNTNLFSSSTDSLATKMVVANTQPSGHGLLWIKPTTSVGTVDYILDHSSGQDMTGTWNEKTLTGFNKASGTVSGTVNYGVKFSIYNYSGNCSYYTMTVVISNGSSSVTVYNQTVAQWVGPGDYFVVDTLASPFSSSVNLTGSNSLSMKVTLYKYDSGGAAANTGARFEINQNFIIRCTGTGSSSAQQCTVYYIP